MYADDSCRVTALLRCPAVPSPDKAGSALADRGHSLGSFLPPQAAVASLPVKIGNANILITPLERVGFFFVLREPKHANIEQ